MTALVTGASSGIGAAFARELAGRGHELVLVARDGQRLQAVAETLPTGADVLALDLTVDADLRTLESRLGDRGSPIDVLVNNAASGCWSSVADTDTEVLVRDVQLNVLAVVRSTRAILPGLLARGQGGIVNLSSSASTATAPSMAAYVASKAFIDSWSRSLAEDVRGTGVTVTCVRAGYTRTDFHRRAGQAIDDVPATRWLTADEVAARALRGFDAGETLVDTHPSPPVGSVARRVASRVKARWTSSR